MKLRILSIARLSFPLATAIAAMLATQSASATAFYWDTDGTTAGFGSSATGTWAQNSTTTGKWTTSTTGVLAGNSSQVTVIGDTFNLGTGSTACPGGTITVSGTVDATSFTFGSATTSNIIFSGGTINLAAVATIAVGAGSTTVHTINSTLTGAGTSLTKSGNVLALSGANSYTGATNITVGTLVYRNTGAKSAPSTHTFSALTTLGLGVATTGSFFTSTDVDNAFAGTMTGNLSNVVVAADTRVGIDTSAGNFTYATSVAGSPTRGLTKLGGNTLTLTGANTYTGSTSILGSGALRLENTAAISGSSSLSVGSGTTLQLATDTPFSGPPSASLVTATTVSDRATPNSPGITHVLGTTAISNSTNNFTKGANVNDGNAAIQLGNVTNASGAGGSATLNPTTANLIVAGGYTGLTNAGANNLILSGSAATNSLTGDITLGTRVNINVTKSGNSIWTLSGNNSVSLGVGSTTTVSGGALVTTTLAALPNSGAVTLSGGTLGARVGAGGWSTTEVDTLLSTATKTSGALGIDTTIGDLTQWTAFDSATNFGTLGLTKLGTNKLTLNSASNTYTGATTIDQGTLELTTNQTLTGGLTFGFNAGTTSNTGTLDLTSSSATFGGAMTVITNSATANEIKIGAAQTLTINNNVQMGASPPSVSGTVTKLNMTGGGVFNVNTAAAGTFNIGGTTLVQESTLDLTALSATTVNTSATGTIRVNALSVTNVSGTKSSLLLPAPVVADTVATATLTAATVAVGNSATFNNLAGQINTIQLGTGLTTLNSDTINVGTGSRDIGRIIFGQAGGDLKIRAADTTSRSTALNVGTGGATTGTFELATNNLVDFSGHDANILVTSLNVGNQARINSLTSEFKFGADNASLASVLDATNVNIGFRTGTATAASVLTNRLNLSGGTVTFGNVGATGTGVDIGNSTYNQTGAASTIGELNISGGTVTINNGTGGYAVRLGSNVVAGGGTVTSSLNLTGGTTTLSGDIVRGTTSPRTTSTVNISGASAILDLGGNDIGTATELITLTAESGELKNVLSINGTGGLTKTTAGTLLLSGTNTYSGDTTVSAGTLRQSSVNTANDASTVTIAATGATLDLTYAGTDTVDKLFIGGVQQAAGIYGPTGINIPQITNSSGSGTLTVLSNPPAGYSSWAGINGASADRSADQDSDGVPNGVEFFIGGPTGNTTGFTALPGVDNAAGILSTTWTKAAGYTGTYSTDYVVETSTTLTGVWTPAALGAAPGQVVITGNNVKYTFPASGAVNFARLKVTGP